jgi:hypothetical protein
VSGSPSPSSLACGGTVQCASALIHSGVEGIAKTFVENS